MAVGFGLPVLALIGLVIAIGFSATRLAGDTVPAVSRYTQISGPEDGPAVAVLDVVRSHRQRQLLAV